MKKYIIHITLAFALLLGAKESNSQDYNAFYIGHSLSDQIPDMVESIAKDVFETNFEWTYQGIPGAPLRWQWDRKNERDYNIIEPHYFGFYDENEGLPTGEFDLLVLTEAVPRYGDLINETYQYADSLARYALQYNPGTKIYLYEDWHCIKSGTPTGCDYDVDANPWRQRLEDDLPMWESVVDTLNSRLSPTNQVCMIPAGQALAQLYDSIAVGSVPGLTSIDDLFSDDIHLTDVGKYFVACVHFATIFGASPVGATNQTQVWWGGDFEDIPTEEQAKFFQEIAWKVSVEYENSCISGTQTNVEITIPQKGFTLNGNILRFKNGATTFSVYNTVGTTIYKGNAERFDFNNYPAGVYFVAVGNEIIKVLNN
jgi:hypothetical protein